jgi:hypothetical protein
VSSSSPGSSRAGHLQAQAVLADEVRQVDGDG